MEILYLGNLPPHPGGSAVSASVLLRALGRSGVRIRCAAPSTRAQWDEALRYDEENSALRVRRFETDRFDSEPARPGSVDWIKSMRPSVQLALRQALEESVPDVCLLGRETYVTPAAPLLRDAGVAAVVRVTGTHLLSVFDQALPAGYCRRLLRDLQTLDSVAVQARHMLTATPLAGWPKVDLIPNCVELERFRRPAGAEQVRQRLNVSPDAFLAIHLSNFKSCKRPLDIVRSAEIALAQAPEIVYVMVGDGSLRPETERLVEQMGLSRSFRFVPWLDYDRIPAAVAAADVVLLPSDFEQQARVSLEAMAAGRLLIAADVPGICEVARDGETALLHRVGDWRHLAEKTIWAARHPQAARAIAEHGQASVQTHDVARIAALYEDLFRRIVLGRLRRKGA